jgi:manganese efflux pump family protein
MDILTPVLIGIALAMDCFAVALARGAAPAVDKNKLAIIFAISFGVFQTGMTILGWAAGSLFIDIIAPYDHWVAFIILAGIGTKMIIEGAKGEGNSEHNGAPLNSHHITALLLLSIATSIDALAIGLGFAFMNVPILVPSLIIGVIAAMLSVAGVYLGTKLERLLGKKIEILGGLILIGIGMKILFEHLSG